MSYASIGGQVGKVARKKSRVSAAGGVGAGVGSYANPAAKLGGTVGSYPGAQAGAAVGGGVGAAAVPVTTGVGTPPMNNPAAASSGATLGGDAGLLSAQDQAQRNTSLADAKYQYTTNALGSDYGFDAQGQVDTNNPYSRAALMVSMAKNQRRGTGTSYAARGQLYSGALQNAQDENARQENIAYDQLVKGYQGQVAQAGLERASTYAAQTGGVSQASLEALLRAIGGSS